MFPFIAEDSIVRCDELPVPKRPSRRFIPVLIIALIIRVARNFQKVLSKFDVIEIIGIVIPRRRSMIDEASECPCCFVPLSIFKVHFHVVGSPVIVLIARLLQAITIRIALDHVVHIVREFADGQRIVKVVRVPPYWAASLVINLVQYARDF